MERLSDYLCTRSTWDRFQMCLLTYTTFGSHSEKVGAENESNDISVGTTKPRLGRGTRWHFKSFHYHYNISAEYIPLLFGKGFLFLF